MKVTVAENPSSGDMNQKFHIGESQPLILLISVLTAMFEDRGLSSERLCPAVDEDRCRVPRPNTGWSSGSLV